MDWWMNDEWERIELEWILDDNKRMKKEGKHEWWWIGSEYFSEAGSVSECIQQDVQVYVRKISIHWPLLLSGGPFLS